MIQINGTRRHVYINFTDGEYMNQMLQETEGHLEYKHDNGEISQVQIEIAGMGTKKLRVANLPPEVKDSEITAHITKYGEVSRITDETWASACRYKVYNGIKIIEMSQKQHLPSNMSIAGNDVLLSYDGQPQTCYRCDETGHQRQDCPRCKRLGPPRNMQPIHTWADVVSNKPQEQDTLMLMLQQPSTREAKTKRHNTPPEEAPDSKRVPTNRNRGWIRCKRHGHT
jgi:hypothetical protein